MMKIIHVCLSSSYTDGLKYQDNMLAENHVLQGHDVTVISNCNAYVGGISESVQPSDEVLACGVRLIRIRFLNFAIKKVTEKIKYSPELAKIIYAIKPDVIFYHGFVGVGIRTVTEYKKNNPNTRLYFDSHADFNNSTNSWLANFIVYKVLYRAMVKNAVKYANNIYYVSLECKHFLKSNFGIADDAMNFLSLGGRVCDMEEKIQARHKLDARFNLHHEDTIFVHSGKMTIEKNTKDIVDAFEVVNNSKQKLFILGHIDDNRIDLLEKIKANANIFYMGWVSGDDLEQYLLAADVYLQPGTQSATLQHAICCGCAICVYPHESHAVYMNGNGVYVKRTQDLIKFLRDCEEKSYDLNELKIRSHAIGEQMLDYFKLAKSCIK